ncbi:long-chain-fatty-acid--CoA ligase [Hwanghaeella grinnelliae]|uniref:3-methylmercaptopropionyl-CoA ligase n=1 Tax=Hwanghaeella grinnelliae TaxID=2500179 RepID=A0A437QU89_9PROT|nr:long-chain fatty acid--CoA ligase [Hwanghaeella grinnelliae]RVU38090.1 long-chain-fatty-acid--CoA ligase [Hwanghaeella grinnelliae]
MRGLMMNRPLLVSSLIEFGAENHADKLVVSRRVEGDVHHQTFAETRDRVAQLAHALKALGINEEDRVATIAWNGHRHLELYYAISGIGAVCHTINPRLFAEQLDYIVNHAADRALFIDLTFVPIVEKMQGRFPSVEHVVIMTDRAHMPDTTIENALCFEDLLDGQPTSYDWPDMDENTAAGLCYTSGTTGNPKGVLYSHRSHVLHALSVASVDGFYLESRDVVLPVVPLFHVNAWGLPYICFVTGTSLVFPGPNLDGASLFDLMDKENVTAAWGVPTVWLGLIGEMQKQGRKPAHLKSMLIGGSAAPRAMIETFEKQHGLDIVHGWGMTEMSPIGTIGVLPSRYDETDMDERINLKAKQGRRLFQVDMKIVDEDGNRQPHDGKTSGELYVRGPFITAGYYNDESASAGCFDAEGWFKTGDVATIDPEGFLLIVDRSKDLIKSGGEWISSIDLENAAIGHPDIVEAAAIGLPHPKWDERPLLVVVPREGATVSKESILDHLASRVAKWWLPDDIAFVEAIPHSATGKIRKTELRDMFKDYTLPSA